MIYTSESGIKIRRGAYQVPRRPFVGDSVNRGNEAAFLPSIAHPSTWCLNHLKRLLLRGDGDDRANRFRVQRTEEELAAGTREREAGEARVRKTVRTDREQIRVPKRHEEVSVERVPVEGREASEAEIGEDEISVPVVEEEVVVEKRPEVKEEIRLRKDSVQEEELVEEDVRREEVDVDDHTNRRRDR